MAFRSSRPRLSSSGNHRDQTFRSASRRSWRLVSTFVTKIMAWSAIDRLVKIIEEFGDGGEESAAMLPHLRRLRERIREETWTRGYNPRLNAFTQPYGSDAHDASVLLMPHVGFLRDESRGCREPFAPSRRPSCARRSRSATAQARKPQKRAAAA